MLNRSTARYLLKRTDLGLGGKVLFAIPRTSLNNLHLKSADGIILTFQRSQNFYLFNFSG
jgi:hypothetical protein